MHPAPAFNRGEQEVAGRIECCLSTHGVQTVLHSSVWQVSAPVGVANGTNITDPGAVRVSVTVQAGDGSAPLALEPLYHED